jgi:hypothetical protein
MGHIVHHAIVVTSWNTALLQKAVKRARKIGCTVLGMSAEGTNGYRSMLVCPDGSKSGWSESDEGDERRQEFKDWMQDQAYEDGSNALSWCEIEFGGDDDTASVTGAHWMSGAERRATGPTSDSGNVDHDPASDAAGGTSETSCGVREGVANP